MSLKQQLTSWIGRAYQVAGVKLGVSQACLGLLMRPGLGKTSVVYMIYVILKKLGFVKRMLVICPLRPAYRVWPHQKDKYQEFCHLQVAILHGPGKEQTLLSTDADICVINPEGLDWLFGSKMVGSKCVLDPDRVKFIKAKFDMLVVDESTKFKNPQTNRFKLLRKFVPHFKRRLILTGTFTPKGLIDLFGQVYILDEGSSLGSYITHYRTEYFYPSGFGGYTWTPQPDAPQRVAKKIKDLVLVVNAEGNIDLPEIVYNDIWIDLPPAARKIYDQMEDRMVADIEEGKVVAANAAVASSKCRQIANGSLFNDDGTWTHLHQVKVDAIRDLIEELSGEPLLITYEFQPDSEQLSGIPSISTGNVRKDDLVIQEFARGELIAVKGQPQSIALGIDGLQDNCFNLCMMGCTWNLQDYLQVIDRIRRSGNKSKHIVLHRVLARNTVDERVLIVLDSRDSTQTDFLKLLQSLRS